MAEGATRDPQDPNFRPPSGPSQPRGPEILSECPSLMAAQDVGDVGTVSSLYQSVLLGGLDTNSSYIPIKSMPPLINNLFYKLNIVLRKKSLTMLLPPSAVREQVRGSL